MTEPTHPHALSDAEWAILAPLLEPATRRGRPRRHDRRLVLDAALYVLRGGLAWRLLPERFPPWGSVYDQFRRWRRAGVWQRVNDALRERARALAGRAPQPSTAIIDRQRARTSEAGGERGYATMAASGSAAASGTSLSTSRASSCTPAPMPPTRTIGAPRRLCSMAGANAPPGSPACSPTWPTGVWAPGAGGGLAGGCRWSSGRAAGCGRQS